MISAQDAQRVRLGIYELFYPQSRVLVPWNVSGPFWSWPQVPEKRLRPSCGSVVGATVRDTVWKVILSLQAVICSSQTLIPRAPVCTEATAWVGVY